MTNVDGEASPGDEDMDFLELPRRLGGVMDGMRNELGDEELTRIGLAAAILVPRMQQHPGRDTGSQCSVEKVICTLIEVSKQGRKWQVEIAARPRRGVFRISSGLAARGGSASRDFDFDFGS